MRGVQRRRRNAGFTLIELLLAVALVALITGAILGGLRLGTRAWETGRSYDARGEIDNSARAISALLKRSFPVEVIDKSNRSVVVFIGRSDGCYFTTLSDGKTQTAGLLLTEIGFRSAPGRQDLAVWTTGYRAEFALSTSRQDMVETTLLSDVESADFTYFGAVEPNQSPAWRDNWVSADRLPEIISVRLGARRHRQILETSLLVALIQE